MNRTAPAQFVAGTAMRLLVRTNAPPNHMLAHPFTHQGEAARRENVDGTDAVTRPKESCPLKFRERYALALVDVNNEICVRCRGTVLR
jgi:hypothetical protein